MSKEVERIRKINATKKHGHIDSAVSHVAFLLKLVDDYEETLVDHRRLVRELDVALNGNGAAKQASLCDIVAQVKRQAAAPEAHTSKEDR